MPEQLNMLADGAQPSDLELGRTQRAVMQVLRCVGELSRDEVGAIVHSGRGRHRVDDRCVFCGVDGDTLIESLKHRGLVDQADGVVRVRVHEDRPVAQDAAEDGSPY